jgi:hypothetical protein
MFDIGIGTRINQYYSSCIYKRSKLGDEIFENRGAALLEDMFDI